jgi:regulator of protease activity HflC (stomatin/prohibitin superfamily)
MNNSAKLVPVAVLLFVVALLSSWVFKSVPAGHVAVATLFGKVVDEPYQAGLHFPVNPLYSWTDYDARQKTHMETAEVPSQDQLTTKIDVSVQYRLMASMTPTILADTGTADQVIAVHLVPKLRSVIREQGKTIKRAEDFFLEETQNTLQVALLESLQASLEENGVIVTEVLIRDITLPQFIKQAIERKKEREQEAERQKAELERYKTEQQELIAQAEAQRQAAEEEAKQRVLLADAQAYEIEQINKAISDNPAYIQLEALKALQEISKDPAAKVYFINSDSPMPLPLMHMGDVAAPK